MKENRTRGVSDVTARRDGDREQRLHARLLELAHDAVIVREPAESRVVFWNREAEAVYGYSAVEADGQVTHDLLQTSFPQSREAIDDALESAGHWAGDLQHVRKDGSVIVVSSRQALMRDEDGHASAIIELNSDVTERRATEGERRLHARLLELAHDAVIVREPAESRVVFWNREAEAVYGYSAVEADGQVTHDLLQTSFPQSREAIDDALESAGHWAGDLQHVRKDGSVIVVSSRQALMRDEDGHASAIIELNSDVTERRATEGEIEHERERLAQAAEHGADAVISIDREQRVRHWSPGAERMLGLTLDQAAGRIFGELIGHNADGGRPRAEGDELIASVLAGGPRASTRPRCGRRTAR